MKTVLSNIFFPTFNSDAVLVLCGQTLKNNIFGRARWLMPVILAFGRPRWVNHLRSGVQDQPGQHGEAPVSTKTEKLAGCGYRACTCNWEAQNHLNPQSRGCSELKLCYCTPAWTTARLSQKIKNKTKIVSRRKISQ